MFQSIAKTMFLSLLASLLMLQAVPVLAQNDGLTDEAIDALIEQALPAGVALEDAYDTQIEEAITAAVRQHPGEADSIVRRAASRVPDKAALIAGAAADVAPHMSPEIVRMVARVAPGQIGAVFRTMDSTIGDKRRTIANRTAEQALREAEQAGESPPARDDRPACPVQ